MARKPDKDMQQPKLYTNSIDPSRTQPTMTMDPRNIEYKPAKPIDMKHKTTEYQPNNKFYKASFWDAPKRKIPLIVKKPKEAKPKPAPAKPSPTHTKKGSPWSVPPQATLSTAPVHKPEARNPEPQRAESPPQWESSTHAESEVEQWSENRRPLPFLGAAIEAKAARMPEANTDLALLPSSVGSMSRMMGLFR